MHVRKRSALPGFGVSMGYTLLYLSLIVLIPLAALFAKSAASGGSGFWDAVSNERAFASYRITFGTSLLAASINSVFGFIVAWSLVRYRFAGCRILDALVDLPFALPTAVSGIALAAVYSRGGWMGQWLYSAGIESAFSPVGVLIAMTFISFPFVVRTLQPALEDLYREDEEAAASLGASRLQTLFCVIVPSIMPAWLTGFALALARSLGEYGCVVFISGNMPMRTEITSLLIVTKLEQYDYEGAAALAVVMLMASFLLLLSINVLQWWTRRRSSEQI